MARSSRRVASLAPPAPSAHRRAPLARLVFVGSTATGRSHVAVGAPCDDAVRVGHGPVAVAALADGAGSRSHAKLGAETVVATVARVLREDFDALLEAGPYGLRERLLGAIDADLAAAAARAGVTPGDLASTLLFVAANEARFVAGHLGDGVIGVRRAGRLEVLSEPENGEFANETVFVPTRRGLGDLRLFVGDTARADGFALLTDGAADGLFTPRAENGHPTLNAAIGRFVEGLGRFSRRTVAAAVRTALEGPVRGVTRDDVGLAVGRRVALDDASRAALEGLVGGVGRAARRRRRRVLRAWAALGADAGSTAIGRRAGLGPSSARRCLDKLARLGWG